VRAGTGTNAGHSLWRDRGELLKTSQLPLAGVLQNAWLGIGSGVAVDPELVEAECRALDVYGVRQRLRIDGRCPVIEPAFREAERADPHLAQIVGSTCSGTGVAQAQFCLRKARQAKDLPELAPYVTDVARALDEVCARGETVIVEGSQGTALSLGFSQHYPYCTSGNCTSTAALDDVGLNWRRVDEVVLIVKAVPSRVGNGPLPGELTVAEQDRRGFAEYGVRTGRRRRKAEGVDLDLIREAVRLNGPTSLALSFCDHLDPAMASTGAPGPLVRRLIAQLEEVAGVRVSLLEFGKAEGAIVECL
jgi:adenylosuccinate synthase